MKSDMPSDLRDDSLSNELKKKLGFDILMRENTTREEQVKAYMYLKSSCDTNTGHEIFGMLTDQEFTEFLDPVVVRKLRELANALTGVTRDHKKCSAFELLYRPNPSFEDQTKALWILRSVQDKQTGHDIYGILVDRFDVLNPRIIRRLRMHADHILGIEMPQVAYTLPVVRPRKKKAVA